MTTNHAPMHDTSTKLSLMGRLMPSIMRLRRSNRNHLTREHVRRHLDKLTAEPESFDPPQRLRRGIKVETREEGGWPIHQVTPAEVEPHGTVIYLHGGGWINEAAQQHWSLVQQIAAEAAVTVTFPVYPLIQAGGSAETVVPAVAGIGEQTDGPLILMGDSAGGTIAMSVSLLLKERGRPADLTVLLSPALDMRMENPEIDVVQPQDPWLVKKGQLMVTERWIGEHREDPILNPILGDTRGVGRLVVFSGTRDLLNPDTRLFVKRARESGAAIEYHEQQGHLHVYPLLPTPEGKRARRAIVSAVREVTTTE